MLLFLLCCLTIESIIDAASSSSSFAPSSSLSNTRSVGWRSGTLTQRQRRSNVLAITVLIRGGDATIDVDSNDDDEENEDEVTVDIENAPSLSTASSSSVVKIRISTSLQSSIVDHTTSLMSSGKRTILSLRQAMARSLPGNPPLSIVKLRHCGRLLDDDSMTVEDVLQLARDDDDDDDDDDTIDDNNEDDENIEKLVFTCDILPPIDTKFGLQLKESTSTLSTQEILHAYYLNVAGLSYLQEQQQQQLQHQSQQENTDSNTLNLLRKKATLVQKQFETNFSNEIFNQITYEHERVLNSRRKKSGIDNYTTTEDDDDDDVFGLIPRDTSSSSSSSTTRRKNSKKHAGVGGGATTNVKRILQKNMNIQWSTTIRNSILFLFFGYFGGRNSFSQTLLLLLSPLCFVIQTRPIKLFLKQLFYTMGEPPGIILSLLPAPQQAIMSCDYSAVMKKLYTSDGMNDNDVLENEEWLLMEREEIDKMKMDGASRWGSTGSSKGGANLEDEEYDDDDDDDYDDDN